MDRVQKFAMLQSLLAGNAAKLTLFYQKYSSVLTCTLEQRRYFLQIADERDVIISEIQKLG
jgi:hypothetical protein